MTSEAGGRIAVETAMDSEAAGIVSSLENPETRTVFGRKVVTGTIGRHTVTVCDDNGKALYVLLYTKTSQEVDKLDEEGNPVYEDVLDDKGEPVYEDGVLDAYGEPVPKRKAVRVIETTVHVTKATRTAIIYEDVDTWI